jgi:hypothetical protein
MNRAFVHPFHLSRRMKSKGGSYVKGRGTVKWTRDALSHDIHYNSDVFSSSIIAYSMVLRLYVPFHFLIRRHQSISHHCALLSANELHSFFQSYHHLPNLRNLEPSRHQVLKDTIRIILLGGRSHPLHIRLPVTPERILHHVRIIQIQKRVISADAFRILANPPDELGGSCVE